jgi:hypothetical protein
VKVAVGSGVFVEGTEVGVIVETGGGRAGVEVWLHELKNAVKTTMRFSNTLLFFMVFLSRKFI